MQAFGLTWTEARALRGWELQAMHQLIDDADTRRRNRGRLA